ncbi:T9SS type A sorting domain-containing protein [Flavobacterium sp. CYK-4]|uniref:fibronectin type III domain-containing protein n=1 Tax=Flavobacterium lotistagni TaxID=2709660 RepID=UPI00140B31E9|nr:fibronectin type III domain-containing protein [Flavobacterium lotistagni]NHM06239.1 T9SS type A sorting domain-containing protein [Flavobacterium lotistagni]
MITNYFSLMGFRKKASLLSLAFLLTSTAFYAQCDPPTPIIRTSLTTDGVGFSWTPPATGATSYDYYVTNDLINYPPIGSESNSTQTGATSAMVTGLNPSITYKIYVRSRCGLSKSSWATAGTFTPLAPNSGCANAPYGLYPTTTFTPSCTGNAETINTNAFAGEYCNINVVANRRYTFSSSVASDYITLGNANLTAIVAHGAVPFVWDSGSYSGVIRYYLNTNSTCGTQEFERTRSVTCGVVPSDCEAPTTIYTNSITSTGAIIHWAFSSSSIYHPTNYYISTSSATPTINTTPSGGVTSGSYQSAITGLTPNTTYYYWMRSSCNPNLSEWVSGGSFTTQATVVSGCVTAIYGQNPSTTFTPACSGSPEVISTNMWAGEYSTINILPNKTYTFTSSVATDFFTVRDNITSVAYASGTSPLVWSSGGNTTELKVFIHTNSSCASQNVNRTFRITCQNAVAGCAAPASLTLGSITSTTANVSWVAANPAPSGGYQYYYSTTNTAPTASTTPSGSTTAVSLNLTALNPNTTYYFWVRSNCGTTQGNWVFGNNFTTVGANAGCTNALYGLYPTETFTPTCFGNDEVMVTDAFAGEYSNVNINANTQYTFKSSVTSDYITITNADATVTYTAGTTPLVWTSGSNSGVIRYYFHTNVACGSQNSNRTRYIACQAATACNTPSGFSASGISTSGATLNWTAASPTPSNGYQYYYSTSNTAPTASTQPTGNVTTNSVTLTGLNASTIYYYWVRSNCGTSQSNWASGGFFSTASIVFTGCTDAIWPQFPSTPYTPSCTGASETIVTNAYCGEFSVINILPNKQYTFSSSVATDFITISDENGTVVRISGTSPVVWLSGSNTGAIRYYFHTDSSCGNNAEERSKFISCTNALANANFDNSSLRLFPNPTKDWLHISNDTAIDSVILINTLGQTVQQQSIRSKEGKIDMSALSPGTYFARVISGETSKTLKVIKE